MLQLFGKCCSIVPLMLHSMLLRPDGNIHIVYDLQTVHVGDCMLVTCKMICRPHALAAQHYVYYSIGVCIGLSVIKPQQMHATATSSA